MSEDIVFDIDRNQQSIDEHWMRKALAQAREAAKLGEVPVGAVLVRDNELISIGHNRQIMDRDPSAHAEIVAMRRAATRLENYRLVDCTLYVSLEPCTMCFGAMIHARVARCVYAAAEPRAGVIESRNVLSQADFYNHKLAAQGGVLADESAALLKDFFKERR